MEVRRRFSRVFIGRQVDVTDDPRETPAADWPPVERVQGRVEATTTPRNTHCWQPKGFYRVLLDCYRVWMGFIRFHRVITGLTVYIGFYWVLPSFTEFYRVLLGFTGFYFVLMGFTGSYWKMIVSDNDQRWEAFKLFFPFFWVVENWTKIPIIWQFSLKMGKMVW